MPPTIAPTTAVTAERTTELRSPRTTDGEVSASMLAVVGDPSASRKALTMTTSVGMSRKTVV